MEIELYIINRRSILIATKEIKMKRKRSPKSKDNDEEHTITMQKKGDS